MAFTTETEAPPVLVSRVRRVSKSGFLFEQNSKAPRLDKMIAHINLYDQATKCMEDELQKQREATVTQKSMGGFRSRPGMGPRAVEYVDRLQDKEVPQWVTDLTVRPAHEDSVVTEVAEIEDVDDE